MYLPKSNPNQFIGHSSTAHVPDLLFPSHRTGPVCLDTCSARWGTRRCNGCCGQTLADGARLVPCRPLFTRWWWHLVSHSTRQSAP
jgi:hypothetical protein